MPPGRQGSPVSPGSHRCLVSGPGALAGHLQRKGPFRCAGQAGRAARAARGQGRARRPHRPTSSPLAPVSAGAGVPRARPRFRPGSRPLAAAAAPRHRDALGSQPRERGGGGGGAGISLGAALTAPLCRSPSGGARWAAQSAFVRAVSHRITRIMRPPGPGRRAGRHRVATGGSRGRAAPPAPAPAREIPIEAAPPAPAPRRMARGRVNGAAAAAGAGPGLAVGGGAQAPFKPPKASGRPPSAPPGESALAAAWARRRVLGLPARDPCAPAPPPEDPALGRLCPAPRKARAPSHRLPAARSQSRGRD